jgi:hypothetical protein
MAVGLGQAGGAPRVRIRLANATTGPEEHEEIEITAEMIEAGCAEIASFDRRYESDEDAVERIYRAMALLRPLL